MYQLVYQQSNYFSTDSVEFGIRLPTVKYVVIVNFYYLLRYIYKGQYIPNDTCNLKSIHPHAFSFLNLMYVCECHKTVSYGKADPIINVLTYHGLTSRCVKTNENSYKQWLTFFEKPVLDLLANCLQRRQTGIFGASFINLAFKYNRHNQNRIHYFVIMFILFIINLEVYKYSNSRNPESKQILYS